MAEPISDRKWMIGKSVNNIRSSTGMCPRGARRRVSISARGCVTTGFARRPGEIEAECKPLNNSSRGDRWVACRSFLLARPIKARGSDSSWGSHLHLSLDYHHHPATEHAGLRNGPGRRRRGKSERLWGPETWPAVNCQHLMSALWRAARTAAVRVVMAAALSWRLHVRALVWCECVPGTSK